MVFILFRGRDRCLASCFLYATDIIDVPYPRAPAGLSGPGSWMAPATYVRLKKEGADLPTRPGVMSRQKIRFPKPYRRYTASIATITISVTITPQKKPTPKLSSSRCAPQFWHRSLMSSLVFISRSFDVTKIPVFLFPYGGAANRAGPAGASCALPLILVTENGKERTGHIGPVPKLCHGRKSDSRQFT